MLNFSLTSFAQDAAEAPMEATAAAPSGGDAVNGKALFNSNCAACHKMDAKATGPALRGVTAKHSTEWLHKWIKNSSAMIKAGDPAAVKLYEEYNKALMTPFPQLSDADIDDILAYTDEVKAAPSASTAPYSSDDRASCNACFGKQSVNKSCISE